MSKSKKDNKIIVFITIGIVLLIGAAFLMIKNSFKKTPVKEVKKLDDIKVKEIDYTLYDNKSDLYKDYFAELKEALTKDKVDDLEYAKVVAKLFVTDFYSLEDKKTNTDVGGLDFIHPDMKENFILKATDTMYKYVESNVYGDRKQELPKVTKVEIKNAEAKPLTYDKYTDGLGYVVTVTITYAKDLGFPKEVTLSIIHQEKKLYIVEIK